MRARSLAALIGIAAAMTLQAPGAAQIRTLDVERELVTRFGFTPAEIGQARNGQAVSKQLPTKTPVKSASSEPSGARARSTMLTGVGARLLRGRVVAAASDTTSMYVNWLRATLAM